MLTKWGQVFLVITFYNESAQNKLSKEHCLSIKESQNNSSQGFLRNPSNLKWPWNHVCNCPYYISLTWKVWVYSWRKTPYSEKVNILGENHSCLTNENIMLTADEVIYPGKFLELDWNSNSLSPLHSKSTPTRPIIYKKWTDMELDWKSTDQRYNHVFVIENVQILFVIYLFRLFWPKELW